MIDKNKTYKKRILAFSIASCLAVGSLCGLKSELKVNAKPGVSSSHNNTFASKANQDEYDDQEDGYYFASMDEAAEYANEIAPADRKKSKAIDNMPGYNPDDTWTILLYMCGSDLESQGRDELSDSTKQVVDPQAQANLDKEDESLYGGLYTLADEMDANGVPLPSFLSAMLEAEDGGDQQEDQQDDRWGQEEVYGDGSTDLEEIKSVPLPENVRMVIQTGGSRYWDDENIDPNYSQRFLYDSTGFKELEKNKPANMGDKQTLKDFLNYGKNNYSADHTMVILWDHGAGVFGAEFDEMYEDTLTLDEMKGAFAESFGTDKNNPPIELLGFDCCLMAGYETADAFKDVSKYMVASEETEPSGGWQYDIWLDAFANDTSMNGAQLGREVADAYMTGSVYFDPNDCLTMSVLDLSKAGKVADAYDAFARKALKAAFKDPYVITELGQAANDSIRYDLNSPDPDIYNIFDLGDFMNNVSNKFSKEKKDVIKAIDKTVLYTRSANFCQNSQGLNCHFPGDLNDEYLLAYSIRYSDFDYLSPAVRALYYYKFSGFLNDNFKQYANSAGLGNAPVIDLNPLYEFENAQLTQKKNGFRLDIGKQAMRLLQDATLELYGTTVKDGKNYYVRYGEDRFVKRDSSKLKSDFDNTWIHLGKSPLTIRSLATYDNYALLAGDILVGEGDVENDMPASLIIKYNYSNNKLKILGYTPYIYSGGVAQSGILPFYDDDVITPVLELEDENGNYDYQFGQPVPAANAKASDRKLAPGDYQINFKIYDLRGYPMYSDYADYRIS